MLREARIICPMRNLKAPQPAKPMLHVRDKLASKLADQFGGYTCVPRQGVGAWVSPDGDTVQEGVWVFDVAMEDSVENTFVLACIADWLKKAAHQDAIYVRSPGGEVHFV